MSKDKHIPLDQLSALHDISVSFAASGLRAINSLISEQTNSRNYSNHDYMKNFNAAVHLLAANPPSRFNDFTVDKKRQYYLERINTVDSLSTAFETLLDKQGAVSLIEQAAGKNSLEKLSTHYKNLGMDGLGEFCAHSMKKSPKTFEEARKRIQQRESAPLEKPPRTKTKKPAKDRLDANLIFTLDLKT